MSLVHRQKCHTQNLQGSSWTLNMLKVQVNMYNEKRSSSKQLLQMETIRFNSGLGSHASGAIKSQI